MVKCRYKYCKHHSRELPKEEAVLVGKSTYYHKDCLEESQMIAKIVDLYAERVEQNPVFSHLRKTITDIVVKQKVDANFLYFALDYASKKKIIKHIPGLYYIVKNDDIKKAWSKRKTAEYMRIEKEKIPQPVDNTTREFKYNAPKQKSVSSLFG